MRSLKSTAITFFIAVLFFNAHAQQNVFVKAYEIPQSYFTKSFEFVKTDDHGYILGNIGCLLKIDSVGNKQLMLQNSIIGPCTLNKTTDGGFIGAGYGGIIKLDSTGNIIWVKQFNFSSTFVINTIRQIDTSGFILGGNLQIGSYNRALLIKTDDLGNVLWTNAFKTNIGSSCNFLTLGTNNSFLYCGISVSLLNPSIGDACVVKIDSSGSSVWAKHYAIQGGSFYTCHISESSDGNYIISGGINGQCLLKIDGLGNQLWMKEYTPQIPSVAQWVEETLDKGLIMGGYLVTFGGVLMKTDSAGNFQWVNTLSGPNIFGGCVMPTDDGGYIMAARVSGANGHGIEIFKTDSLGQTGGCIDYVPPVTVTDVLDTVISVPVIDSVLNITTSPITITFTNVGNVYDFCPTGLQKVENNFELSAFPNPAISEITFQYKIAQNATLQISDATGRLVKQQHILKNTNAITIDVSTMSGGMYFYNFIFANGITKTGKFVKQ